VRVPAELPTLLSRALIAFTIEFDNEFEHRMPHRTARGPQAHSGQGPWLVSLAMWANFLRFVDAGGVALTEVDDLARLVNLGGLQRWGYVTVDDGIVRLTRAGQGARRVWAPLAAEIELRWSDRFGADLLTGLNDALSDVADRLDPLLPWYLPVAGVYRVDPADQLLARPRPEIAPDLSALLSRVLLAFAHDFEQESRLSLALCANLLRVLSTDGIRLRDLPALTGVSREAVSVSAGFLERHELAVVEPAPSAGRGKQIRLVDKGKRARDKYHRLLRDTDRAWSDPAVDAVRAHLIELIGDRDRLARGLRPYPDGWRANPPYAAATTALLRDPAAALPQYPMVSHRGGYPDGS
jgi:DNA-binding MarR family transcriptional regulator